jgi:hypothetical protein
MLEQVFPDIAAEENPDSDSADKKQRAQHTAAG